MIEAYKGRTIDPEKPVRVYRNLHRKGIVWSIRQGPYVVGHTKSILLVNAKFIVSEKGRERVRREGKKNVHAFVEGYVAPSAMGLPCDSLEGRLGAPITYNPYKYDSFMHLLTDKPTPVTEAMAVMLNQKGVTASYVA